MSERAFKIGAVVLVGAALGAAAFASYIDYKRHEEKAEAEGDKKRRNEHRLVLSHPPINCLFFDRNRYDPVRQYVTPLSLFAR